MHHPTSASIEWLDDGTPYSPHYDDVYRPRACSDQSHGVFVGPCGIESHLREHGRVAVLETGLGLAMNLAETLRTLLLVPGAALEYVAIERYPASLEDLRRARHEPDDADKILLDLIEPLYDSGCAEVECGNHRLSVRIVLGDGARALAQVDRTCDAVYLDGFAPDRNPDLWSPEVMGQVARIARPGARLATYTVARSVRDALTDAGFDVHRVPGHGRKRHRLEATRRVS